MPQKPAGTLDKAAAGRFIKAGIDSEAKRSERIRNEHANVEATRKRLANQATEVGPHSRFRTFDFEGAAKEGALAEPEPELEVNVAEDEPPSSSAAGKKRKKAQTDPLVGYEDEAAQKAAKKERKRLKKLAKQQKAEAAV